MHINELFKEEQINEGPLDFAKKVGAGIKGLSGGVGNAVQSYQQKGHEIQGQDKANNIANYLIQQFMQNMGGRGQQPTMQDLVKFLQSHSLDTKSIEQTPIQQAPQQQQQAPQQQAPQQAPTPKTPKPMQQAAPAQRPLPKPTHPAPTQIQSKIHTGNPLKEAPSALAQQAGGNGLRPIDIKNMVQKVVQANYDRIMSGDSTKSADGSEPQQPSNNGQQAPTKQSAQPQQSQQQAEPDGKIEPKLDQEPEQAPQQAASTAPQETPAEEPAGNKPMSGPEIAGELKAVWDKATSNQDSKIYAPQVKSQIGDMAKQAQVNAESKQNLKKPITAFESRFFGHKI
jgi:hypothetical protein